MIYTDLELAQIELEALFVQDMNGKLLNINEPTPTRPAPRFFLIRTRSGCLWRARHDVPIDLATELGRLAFDEPLRADLVETPRYAAKYTELLEQHAPVTRVDTGLAYYLPESDLPQQATMITAENISLVEASFPWLVHELAAWAPVAATVVDQQAVTLCFSSRISARAAAAGIETIAGYRGRGYATTAGLGWAAAVRASGRLPFYDTSWRNYASQAVVRKLGGIHYAAAYSLT